MAQETMDNVRAGGRRRDAGQRMREQQHVAIAVRRARRVGGAQAARRGADGPDRLRRAGQGARRRQAPFNGKTVSIQTQWIGGEGTNFAAAVADFATATGIKIQIDSIGSSHETVLKTRIEGGKPPDLAMLAQPTPSWRTRPRQGHRRREVHGCQEAQR